jgi:hypothetical protein
VDGVESGFGDADGSEASADREAAVGERVDELAGGVDPEGVGSSMVATWTPVAQSSPTMIICPSWRVVR